MDPVELRDTKLVRQEVVLRSSNILHSLGPRLVLEDCRVRWECGASTVIVSGLTMNGGSLDAPRGLKNKRFEDAHFRGVQFTGKFVGCDFGEWDPKGNASIQDCGFENAHLDLCRIRGSDPSTLAFPAWPCFVIRDPHRAREFFESRKWPFEMGITLGVVTNARPDCRASIGDAQRLARVDDLTLDQVRALLDGMPGLQIREAAETPRK